MKKKNNIFENKLQELNKLKVESKKEVLAKEQKVKDEEYDDVFFVDDSLKNVDAVRRRLKSYPNVKQKIQHIKHS